jgi:hypothetical protein
MKEKHYTVSIDVQVTREDGPNAKRWYTLKMYGHPIGENSQPFEFQLSNFRNEQALKVGKKLLDAIWNLVEIKDKGFWESK